MLERISNFKGSIPRLHPRLLPKGYAQVADSTRLDSGALDPLRDAVAATTLAVAAQTLYKHLGVWMSWATDVDAVPGPVADDRLYITGDGSPKLYQGGTTYDLALAAPAAAPIVTIANEPVATDANAYSILYAYTFVTSFGEESPPSPASASHYWIDGTGLTASISNFSAPPASRAVTKMRIYRSQTALDGTTTLYFVAEIPVTDVSYIHDPVTAPLQEALPSNDYDPPTAAMAGITAMPNGMMAAFDGKKVLFSEPYIPHAWPIKYRQTIDYDVVGLVALGSNLIVLTTGTPYIMQGTAPDNMVSDRLQSDLPCVSKRGIVDLGYRAVYPSIEGFVEISGNGQARVVSRELFKLTDWQALNASTITATNYNGRYMFSWKDAVSGARSLSFVDVTGDRAFYATAPFACAGFWRDLSDGSVYYIEGNDTGTAVKQWDAGAPLTLTWKTGRIMLPTLTNFGLIRIDTDDAGAAVPSLTYKVYADGVLKHTGTTHNAPDRLPGDFLSDQWEIEVVTNLIVSMIQMAGNFEELMGAG